MTVQVDSARPDRLLFPALILLGIACACTHDEGRAAARPSAPAQSVAPEPPTVAALIEQLVSPVPAPHPDFYSPTSLLEPWRYEHPQVQAARARLEARGTGAYPELVEHMHDERYSYSSTSAVWLNHSVGTRIRELLSKGMTPCGGGYEEAKVIERHTPKGMQERPSLDAYFTTLKLPAWAEKAAREGHAAIRRDFVEWYVNEEEKLGFIDRKQRKLVLDPCLAELGRLREQP